MSILSEINTVVTNLGIPSETGIFSGKPPDEYIVVTPMSDTFGLFADNKPQREVQEARLSVFSKNNYMSLKNRLVKGLMQAGLTITERRYIGYEQDTKFHNYSIDVAKCYGTGEDNLCL